AGDESGVFAENAAGGAGTAWLEGGQAGGVVVVGDEQGDRVLHGIDLDGVPRPDDADRAAVGGLGGDVTDVEPVGAAGEAAVGDEGDVLDEAAAGDGGGGGKHFAHAGAADGTFVADDDHIALHDVAAEDALER